MTKEYESISTIFTSFQTHKKKKTSKGKSVRQQIEGLFLKVIKLV